MPLLARVTLISIEINHLGAQDSSSSLHARLCSRLIGQSEVVEHCVIHSIHVYCQETDGRGGGALDVWSFECI